jgi:hypothetical protein
MDDISNQHNSTESQLEHHVHGASCTLFQPSLHNSDQLQAPLQHQSSTETASSSSTSTWDVVEAHLPSTPHSRTSAFPELDAALQSANTALATVRTASNTLATTLSNSAISQTTRSLAASATASASTLATWAASKTSSDARDFVRSVHEWLLRSDMPVPASIPVRRRGQRRATAPGASEPSNGIIRRSDPLTFGDEQGAFVLDTRYVDDGLSLLGPRRASVSGYEASRGPALGYSLPLGVPASAASSEFDSETEKDSFIGSAGPGAGRSIGSGVRATESTRVSDGWVPAATGFNVAAAAKKDAGGA